jgi:hypothetical protein
MRALAAAAALLLSSCFDPQGRCGADADCLPEQICGPDALCVAGTRPPPGDPPVAREDAYAVAKDGVLEVAAADGVLANDSDPGGGALTAVMVGHAAFGQVYLAPDGGFTYAPSLGYTGPYVFSYRATNGVTTSAETTVSIAVGP